MSMLQRGYEFAPGYRLQEFLGRGQFGQVWRAAAPGGTTCAVKFIDLTDGQGQKEYHAIERIKQIQHANLMTITAIWLLDDEGRVIADAPDENLETQDISELPSIPGHSGMLVMPQHEPAMLAVGMLLGGESLLARLKTCVREGKQGIPWRELLSYMEDSAKGLDFLNEPRHNLGSGPVSIQHCDVKPANIVLYGNAAVVCDFGLARILSRTQATSDNPAGTPAYMAPEAIDGQPSRSSDQYSLAITYYHLRTATLPLKDGTLYEVLQAHQRGDLSFDQVPAAEQEVLRRATDLDWKKRFSSSIEFVDHLRDSLRGIFPPNLSDAITIDPPTPVDPVVDPLTQTKSLISDVTDPAEDAKPTPAWKLKRRFLVGTAALLASTVMIWIAFIRGQRDETVAPTPDTAADVSTDYSQWDFNDLVVEAQNSLATDPVRAAAAYREALIRRPSLATPLPMQTVEAHGNAMTSMLLTASGDGIVSASYDMSSSFHSIAMSDQSGVAMNPIGSRVPLASLSDHIIQPNAIGMSASGDRLLAAAGRTLGVWDLTGIAGSSNQSLDPIKQYDGLTDTITAITGHSKYPEIAVAGTADLSVAVIDFSQSDPADQNRPKMFRFDCTDVAKELRVDPSGDYLIAVGQNEGAVIAYPWSDIIASNEQNRAPLKIRVTAPGIRGHKIGFPTATADAKPTLIVASENGSLGWYGIYPDEAKLLDQIQPHHDMIEAMSIKATATDAGDLVVCGSADGEISENYLADRLAEKDTRKLSSATVSCVDVSSDGRWIAAGVWDGNWWLFDRTDDDNSGAQIPVSENLASETNIVAVESIKINEAAGIVLVGCDDGTIRVWDLRQCQLLAISQLMPEEEIRIKPTEGQTAGLSYR